VAEKCNNIKEVCVTKKRGGKSVVANGRKNQKRTTIVETGRRTSSRLQGNIILYMEK
jgi:hypothetical protein